MEIVIMVIAIPLILTVIMGGIQQVAQIVEVIKQTAIKLYQVVRELIKGLLIMFLLVGAATVAHFQLAKVGINKGAHKAATLLSKLRHKDKV